MCGLEETQRRNCTGNFGSASSSRSQLNFGIRPAELNSDGPAHQSGSIDRKPIADFQLSWLGPKVLLRSFLLSSRNRFVVD